MLSNERMRETHARLRMLASRTVDPDVRAERERICAEMVAPPPEMPTARLSRRELDVLACVAQGKTNIETAADMGIGAETVKSYRRSVMRKLDAHPVQAVNAARRMGALPRPATAPAVTGARRASGIGDRPASAFAAGTHRTSPSLATRTG